MKRECKVRKCGGLSGDSWKGHRNSDILRRMSFVLRPFLLLLVVGAAPSCAPSQDCNCGELLARQEKQWADGTLAGWHAVGKATFSFEDGVLTGTGNFYPNSFMVSDKEYSDFQLTCDVRINEGGNSGIQIRSRVTEEGRVVGYQLETDGKERAWSGGLYDEGGRGWLQDLSNNPDGRAAFKVGEWNRYVIRAVGDHIQSWVNGVPITDYHGDAVASGIIGLQVHSGGKTTVSWKNLFIEDLNQATAE